LKTLLADERARADAVVAEIEADATKFGDARRTRIEAVAPVAQSRAVPDEPVTITLSRNGWIRSRQGHGLDASQFAYKAGDAPLAVLETRTVHPLVVLDTGGRAYTIRAADVPGGRGDGVPATTLIDLPTGAKVAQAIVGSPEQKFLVAGTGGYGFVATLSDMISRVRAGKAFMTLEPDEQPLRPLPLAEGLDQVAALSSNGRLLVFGLDEMREVSSGRGVIVMGLDEGERLIDVALVGGERVVVQGTTRGGKAATVAIEGEALARHRLRRARKGTLVGHRLRPTGFASVG
jgi:topoisomerase-4 subunit A